jgi:SAM-dependent methyltransferase
MLWWRGLLPRIARHLPAAHVLEIGPGFGRWTQHLLPRCRRLTAVDLTERCVEHCRSRFGAHAGFSAWTNDGESLEMVPDASVDFVFSFDSLVHAEATVLRNYLRQLARTLKPGGTGFIHHSNLQALAAPDGSLPSWLARTNWRGPTMSARLFRTYCAEAGLRCTSQEVVNWISRSRRADRHRISGRGLPLTDVFSTFERPDGAGDEAAPVQVYLNPGFAEEWRQIVVLASMYQPGGEPPPVATSEAGPRKALSARIVDAMIYSADYAGSWLRDHATAARVARREPILNAVRRGRCPDCSAALSRERGCIRCGVRFVL